jgi:GTPase
MLSGTARANDTLMLGPDANGAFQPVSIKGIHRKRHAVQQVFVCFGVFLFVSMYSRPFSSRFMVVTTGLQLANGIVCA